MASEPGSFEGVILALLAIALNAFFVATEFAIVKARITRIDELARAGGLRARIAQRIVREVDEYISATQLGITGASLALGWVGEPAFAALLQPVFDLFGTGDSKVVPALSFAVAFACITALHIVVGELAPKTLSIRHAETIALNVAVPLRIFYLVFYPVLRAFRVSADAFLRIFGVRTEGSQESAHSEAELRLLLAESHRSGSLSGTTRRLLENVFSYRHRVARDVMVPRGDIVYLSVDRPWSETLRAIQQSEHTRYPLCDGELDRVLGLVHMKDLFHVLVENGPAPDLSRLKREALFVAERRPLELLRRDFQSSHQHMAIVVDEYGGTAGLVTLEDVLEEIVGEIRDEFDWAERPKIENTPAGLLIDGLARFDEVQAALGLDAQSDQGRTVGGHVSSRLGRQPRVGDEVDLGNARVRVVEMKGRRIAKLLARPGAATKADPSGAARVQE
jgi:CBS domain containing-hemolysin-like protein